MIFRLPGVSPSARATAPADRIQIASFRSFAARNDLLARLDLDSFSGSRIASHSRGAAPDLNNAQASNPHPLASLEPIDDPAKHIREDCDGLLHRVSCCPARLTARCFIVTVVTAADLAGALVAALAANLGATLFAADRGDAVATGFIARCGASFAGVLVVADFFAMTALSSLFAQIPLPSKRFPPTAVDYLNPSSTNDVHSRAPAVRLRFGDGLEIVVVRSEPG